MHEGEAPIETRKCSLLAGEVPANNHGNSAFLLISSSQSPSSTFIYLSRIPRVPTPLVVLLGHDTVLCYLAFPSFIHYCKGIEVIIHKRYKSPCIYPRPHSDFFLPSSLHSCCPAPKLFRAMSRNNSASPSTPLRHRCTPLPCSPAPRGHR